MEETMEEAIKERLNDILINNNQSEDLDIADEISNETGWCINSWNIDSVNVEDKNIVIAYSPDYDDNEADDEESLLLDVTFDRMIELAEEKEFPLTNELKELLSEFEPRSGKDFLTKPSI